MPPLLRYTDPLKEVMLLKVLGEGSYATVYMGVLRATGQLCALKALKPGGGCDDVEIGLLRQLQHPNIVALLGAWSFGGKISCALSLADLSLLELAVLSPLSEEVVREAAAGVLRALAYLHGKGIIHRDVKSANVLLLRDRGVLLSDLGVSAAVTAERNCRTTLAGSPLWLAPEVVTGKPYGTAADIWSLGILLCEILDGGRAPLSDVSVIKAVFRIASDSAPPPAPARAGLSTPVLALVASCLRRNPAERPSAAELLEHPFFAGAPPGEGAVALDDAIEAALPLLRRAAYAPALAGGGGDAGAAAAAAAPTSPPSEDATSFSLRGGGGGGSGGGGAAYEEGSGSLLVSVAAAAPPPPPPAPPPPPLLLPRVGGTLRRSSSSALPVPSAASSSGGGSLAPRTTTSRGVAEPLKRLPWLSPTGRPPPQGAAGAPPPPLGGGAAAKRAELLEAYARVCAQKDGLERELAALGGNWA